MTANLMVEVTQFQAWAATIPPERRCGEWECDYRHWNELYAAIIEFVDAVPFDRWSHEEMQAVLFVVARDNELEHLANEIRCRKPETLVALARVGVEYGERDAKWQLAEQLGQLGRGGDDIENLLLTLVRDEDEYVRRRSLKSLAQLGSPAVEELALAEWQRPGEHQQWSRMMVLWCLSRVGSPFLATLLAEAEQDERQYLSDFARKIRQGEVEP